ncbi:MAG TPA: arsenosugar biosynthesis radical SAM (seleno)protein ArsS [Gammaproteobacteria bacterium]
MLSTQALLANSDFPALRRARLETLQVNLGYRCNLQCQHCHVNAGPKRTEVMTREVVDTVLAYLERWAVPELDLTGGAPELNPHFRMLVGAARERGAQVIDRCNLTVLEEPGQEQTAEFLARQRVRIVASLPCYLEENVDHQRGRGVFDSSIRVLRRLNALGYGEADSGLQLDLVYNPQGPVLPPPQAALEQDYKRHLEERYGVRFSRLLTLANMPINRFGSTLLSKRTFDDYMATLRGAHSDANLATVMCRSLLSVDWQGYVYDCDFNQMLGMSMSGCSAPVRLADLLETELPGLPIAVAGHCYGCTAGQGSSCGGAL